MFPHVQRGSSSSSGGGTQVMMMMIMMMMIMIMTIIRTATQSPGGRRRGLRGALGEEKKYAEKIFINKTDMKMSGMIASGLKVLELG